MLHLRTAGLPQSRLEPNLQGLGEGKPDNDSGPVTWGQYIIYLGKDLEGYLWSKFSTYRLGSPKAEKEEGMGKRPSFGPWSADTM